jgi:hypothetical protein
MMDPDAALQLLRDTQLPCGCYPPYSKYDNYIDISESLHSILIITCQLICIQWLNRSSFVHPYVPDSMLYQSVDGYMPARRLPLELPHRQQRLQRWSERLHHDNGDGTYTDTSSSIQPGQASAILESLGGKDDSISRKERIRARQYDNPSLIKPDVRPRIAASKEARTGFQLISVSNDRRHALYHIELLTGRTHQIRIHLADAGTPYYALHISLSILSISLSILYGCCWWRDIMNRLSSSS